MNRRQSTPPRKKPEDPWVRALGLLAVRARSEAEMSRKLGDMGFGRPVVEQTIAKLRSRHLLDDESFARDWIEQRLRQERSGPLLLQRDLERRGINPSLTSRLLEEIFIEGRETLNARELLEKKFGSQDLTDSRVLRRAIALLQRRGYGQEVIRELLDDQLQRLT